MRKHVLPLGLAAILLSPFFFSCALAQPAAVLTLERAQELAASKSFAVSAAQREVDANDGAVRQAGAWRNPELNASVEDIVLVGLLGGGAVLLSERAKPGGEEAEHSEAGHGDKEEHAADGKAAHKDGEKDEHGHEAKAEPKGGHKEGEKEEHEERQVKLTEEQLKASGITVQAAGPAKLQAAAQFQGEIRFNDDRQHSCLFVALAHRASSRLSTWGDLVDSAWLSSHLVEQAFRLGAKDIGDVSGEIDLSCSAKGIPGPRQGPGAGSCAYPHP